MFYLFVFVLGVIIGMHVEHSIHKDKERGKK
jgi:hypothetical protein